MGRKKKTKNKLKDIDFIKLTVLVVLFGIVILAVLSPQSLSEIESAFGIRISNIIDYEASLEKSNVYENVVDVETVEATELVIHEDKLNIFFLDVGQADSSLIIYNDKTMLIDAGNVNDGDKIVDCIKGLGIKKLDYVIGTHIHEDHIQGLKRFINVGSILFVLFMVIGRFLSGVHWFTDILGGVLFSVAAIMLYCSANNFLKQ